MLARWRRRGHSGIRSSRLSSTSSSLAPVSATSLWGGSSSDLETELELQILTAPVQEFQLEPGVPTGVPTVPYLFGAPTRVGAECRLLALWTCGGWICSSSSLASGDESGSRAKEAWGVAPADVAPWCFSSHPAGWVFFAARFKACVRLCLSWLQFPVVLPLLRCWPRRRRS